MRELLVLFAVLLSLPAFAADTGEQAQAANLFGLKELPVGVKVRPVGDGLVREGHWSALQVRLVNRKGPTTATLRLDELDVGTGQTTTWTRTVELPEGARKEVFLPWRPGMTRPERTLLVDVEGLPIEADFRLRRVADGDVVVGVVGDDPLGIQTLRTVTSGRVPSPYPHPPFDGRQVHHALLPTAELPDTPWGYGAMDWVVWPQPEPADVDPQALDALLAWVAGGGHLMVVVTDTWRSVAGSALGEALPVTLEGVEDLHDPTPLLADLGVPDFSAGTVPVTRARLREVQGRSALPLAQDAEGGPLWVAGTYGLGTVHVLGADPRVGGLARADRQRLWRRLLFLPDAHESLAPLDALSVQEWSLLRRWLRVAPDWGQCRHESGSWRLGDTWGDWDHNLTAQLADIPGAAPLPMSWLLAFSGLYLLVIGPVDFLVLRFLRREVLTWITFPLTIAIFSTAALVGTSVVKGNQAVMNRVEVVDVLPGTDLWRGSSYLGVFATRRADITLTPGFPGAVARPSSSPGFMTGPAGETSEGATSLSWRAETWSLAYARTSWFAPGTGTVRMEDGLLVNDTPFDLEDAFLIDGDEAILVGRIPAGGAARLGRDGTNAVLHAEGLDLRYALMIEHLEEDYGHLDAGGAHGPTLLARAAKPVEPLEVSGLNPDSVSLTVLRIPLHDRSPPSVSPSLVPGGAIPSMVPPPPLPHTFDTGSPP